MRPLADFQAQVRAWREEVALLRRRGASDQADALESAAEDLEDLIREWRLEALTLEEAAEEVGLAYDTIGRKVREGEIPNAGEKGSPRVRRCDLHPWLDAPEPRLHDDPVEDLAERTLRAREGSA